MTMATAPAAVRSRTLAESLPAEGVIPLRDAGLARLADYAALAKVRIAAMVLVTVAVGYTLGCQGSWHLGRLWPTLVGVGLVAAASSALNQWLERATDQQMIRTFNRPLAAGRLQPAEVVVFAFVSGASGLGLLAVLVNITTAVLALLTLLLYVGLYTPLQQRTSVCTVIGAVPGALPPVLGWTAAGGRLDAEAFSLFAILFLWQFPHFLAIAWLYRRDYESAGLKMLPASCSGVAGLSAVSYAATLLPVSLLPQRFGLAGDVYALTALLLGLLYLVAAVCFARRERVASARRLLWASLLYLPCLLVAMTIDHVRLLM